MPCAPNLNSTSFFHQHPLLTQETGESPFPLLQLSQSHSSSDQTGLHCRTFAPMSCLKVPPSYFIKADFCSSSASLVKSYFFYDSFCHFLKTFFFILFLAPLALLERFHTSPIREGGFFTPTEVGPSSRVPYSLS